MKNVDQTDLINKQKMYLFVYNGRSLYLKVKAETSSQRMYTNSVAHTFKKAPFLALEVNVITLRHDFFLNAIHFASFEDYIFVHADGVVF